MNRQGGLGEVVGPDVVLPGSQQLAPAFWAVVTVLALIGAFVAWLVRRRRARAGMRRRPLVIGGLGAFALVAAVLTGLTWPPPFTAPEFPPLGRLFPEEAFFHRSIDDLPVSPESDRWIRSFADEPVVAGFGDEPTAGVLWGIPFNPVDRTTPREEVDIVLWRRNSYLGEYPIADPAYIESMPTYGFDNHYVAIDLEERAMWELLAARVWFGRWEADSGARWDLDEMRFPQSSTMASGLPLLPGVLSWHDVDAGEVTHVVHAATPTTGPEAFIWPSRGTDGRSTDPDAPPMGAWLRLRSDVDLTELGPQARIIAEGLQRHGMILSDTGPNFALRGTPDARWDRSDLRTLRTITGADFEVVDASGIMVDPGSMEARPPEG
jgi:hypothetical protein